jgi:uridine kinase
MSLIISIDGNIGSGKTTFITELKKKNLKNVVFVDEPVEFGWIIIFYY